VVLEAIPAVVAERVTAALKIPTLGIGAGPACSGQVLVWHDLLGLSDGPSPRFVKRYAEVGAVIAGALRAYADDVRRGIFPDESHTYGMPEDEREQFEAPFGAGKTR
jgi:3-methyl-2-oxobutanoate hydroxymethyltransferase